MNKFIPNLLSILRLVLSFFLIPLVLKKNLWGATVLFAVAAASDFLDGYWARKFQVLSNLGAVLDPLADKVLMIVSYSLFAHVEFIPTYVAIIVIGRDILILFTVLTCKILSINIKIQPLPASKINTAIQLIFIILVLSCNNLSINVPSYFRDACAMIVCASCIFSGAEYVHKYYWIKDKIFSR
ncbi:MAG: CDP-alcohol phosphatidyltransferase family protein [Holosporaceae bacterium]|jgi:cardiolipin synthase|nr:CDP-alcohol phosphatidyltransferase family protein [Holosporaceae bacterium]